MRIKMTLTLDLDVPDTTALAGDAEMLLENFNVTVLRKVVLHTLLDEYMPTVDTTHTGKIDITSIPDSHLLWEIRQVPLSRWYVDPIELSKASKAGYAVKESTWGYSAINPQGYSILRGACDTSEEAWWHCYMDWQRTKDMGR